VSSTLLKLVQGERMGSGVYNITLTEKGQKVENARIIVK
jgi:hypothetical protein